jgi:hypothetical protein
MEFADVWTRIRTAPKTVVKALVDDALAVAHGSADRQAYQLAQDVLTVVRSLYPDLLPPAVR